jgi:hypothetical protein
LRLEYPATLFGAVGGCPNATQPKLTLTPGNQLGIDVCAVSKLRVG